MNPVGGFFEVLATDLLAMSLLAAGEEALYRGVIYEEIKTRSGSAAAMLTDAALFPLIHVPGDVYSGFGLGTVAFQFLWRAGMTLVFDRAYDLGGLPLSAAVHMWSDVVLLMVRWLVYGGIPDPAASGSRLPLFLPESLAGSSAQMGLCRGDAGELSIRFTVPL